MRRAPDRVHPVPPATPRPDRRRMLGRVRYPRIPGSRRSLEEPPPRPLRGVRGQCRRAAPLLGAQPLRLGARGWSRAECCPPRPGPARARRLREGHRHAERRCAAPARRKPPRHRPARAARRGRMPPVRHAPPPRRRAGGPARLERRVPGPPGWRLARGSRRPSPAVSSRPLRLLDRPATAPYN